MRTVSLQVLGLEMTTGRAARASAIAAAATLLAFACNVALAAGPAAVPATTTTAAASAPADDQLENVVITARRVEESQQSVPVAVTALSEKDLQQQIVLDVQDLQTSTPGLFIAPNSQGGAPTFAIRGAKADNGTSPTVAVYIDDVPVNSTLAVANMVYDMQSITTLKGPQGTLFGADSTGGAIVFRPNKPTDQFEGYAQLGFGNYDRKEIQAMINLPVNEMLQIRLAGEAVRRDGFETNITPMSSYYPAGTPTIDNSQMDNDKHESLRLSVRLKLSDTLLNDLVVDYFHVGDQPDQAQATYFRTDPGVPGPGFLYPTFLGFSVPVSYQLAGVKVLPPFEVSTSADPTWNKAHLYGIANTTTWEVTPNWTLKNALGYRHDATDTSENNGDAGPYPVVDGRTTHTTSQWTEEPSSTITWDDGKWTNKTGIYLFYSDEITGNAYKVIGLPWNFTGISFLQPVVDDYLPLEANGIYDTLMKEESVYDQASVKLTPELTFTAGARYSYDQGAYVQQNRTAFAVSGGLGPWGDFSYGPPGPCAPSGYANFNPTTCAGTASLRSSAPSFTLSLEDQFADKKMIYTSLKGGYLVGGFNNQVAVPAGQTFQPERVTEFEGGLKADWNVADRPLRTNLAVFYGTYRDQQRTQNGTTAAGVTYIAVQNAGSTVFYGADLDLTYAATDYLTLAASWEHLISQYTNYDASVNVPGITAAIDLTGVQEAQTPKNVFTADATVKWPVPQEFARISSTLSFYYRSWSYGHDGPTIGGSCAGNTVANPVTTCTAPGTFVPNYQQNFTALDLLPSFGIANFTTDINNIAGTHLDAQLWIKNLTNKVYDIYNSNQTLQYGYATYSLGDPRTFGVRLRYNF